jgi:hypothetical protein
MSPARRGDCCPAGVASIPGNAGFWAQWAEVLPPWSPPLRPLLIVAPHPDDAVLGAGGLLSALSLPDGELGAHEQRIADTIRELLQPQSLLVAPFELDGHPDHDTAGRAALIAVRTGNWFTKSFYCERQCICQVLHLLRSGRIANKG